MNRRWSRALFALVPALLACSALSLAPARSIDARPAQVATLPVWTPPNVNAAGAISSLALNPKSRRGYQLTQAGAGTLITAFDLDTLEPLGSRTVPFAAFSLGSNGLDADRGLLYFTVGRPWFGGVAMLDEAKFKAGDPAAVKYFATSNHPVYNTSMVVGVRMEPRTQKILLVMNPQRTEDSFLGFTRGKTPYANFIAQWDANTGAEDWLHPITECSTASVNQEVGSTITPFLSADGKNIYAMCSTSESEMQMLRLAIPGPGAKPTGGQLYPVASGIGTVMIDPVAERVHMISNSAYLVTFDWKTKRVAGTASISNMQAVLPVAFGAVDVETGRIMVSSPPRPSAQPNVPNDPGGLLLIDGRRTTLPQALVFDNVAGPGLHTQQPPAIDPAGPDRPRRIFLRHSTPENPNNGQPFFRVIADPLPVSIDPPDGELDPTVDVDESEATQTSFAGEANGYGTRVLMVGGIQGSVNLFETTGKCGPTNRDIAFASNQRATLSTVTAAARADGADADLGTQADLRDLSRCGNGGTPQARYPAWPKDAQNKGPGWAYQPAECSGNNSTTSGSASAAYTATATCEQAGATVGGEVTHVQAATAAGLTVGKSYSTTKVRRDPALGIVSEITSVSEGIAIADVGSIASVTSTAMSRANGRVPRPSDPARSAWTVTICGVSTAQFKDQGCRSGPEATELIARLNEAGRNRVIFRQPAVDPDLIKGSPGGYVAGVQRDRGEAALAKLENGDELMSVPGLEAIIRTNPDGNVKRYMVQFAGVRAVSTYGIIELPSATMDFDQAEDIVEELGLEVNTDGGFGAGGPIAQPAPSIPEQILQAVGDAVERVFRTAFTFDFRNPGDVALALGVWLTFGTPLYLAERRRRYRGMLL